MTRINGQAHDVHIETKPHVLRDDNARGLSEDMHAEARRRVAPIYLGSRDKGSGTAMFLAMNELQRLYPKLNEAELETLFFGVLREIERGGSRTPLR